MADYRIQIGTELDTKGIDAGLKKYQGKPIEIKSKLDTSGIDKKLAGYKAKKPIEVNAKLNTAGLAKKIGEYKPKTPIKLNAKLDTKNIDATIRSYKAKKSIEVNVKLNHSAISEQIRNYKAKSSITLNTKLDNGEITRQIKAYQAKTPINLKVKLTTKDIDEKIRTYKTKTPIKLDVKINKGTINEQIKGFVPKSTIQLKAALQKGTIAEEIRNFKPSTPIRVALELDPTDIDNKISAYKSKPPVEIPAKLKLNVGDINSQLQKYKLTVPIKLNVKQLDTNGLEDKIKNYNAKSTIKVGVQLDSKSINEQIARFPKATAPINVGVNLDESAINADIALFKPTATLGIQPDLIIENVDDQIRAYIPKAKIRVNVDLNNSDIDQETRKQSVQTPIKVNVELDRAKINEQIRTFITKTKIKVGVKLDSNGIAEQIKKISPKTKIKVGIKIDKDDIAQQIRNANTGTPIRLGVELDESDIQNQIDNIRRQIQNIGNININLGAGVGAVSGVGGGGGQIGADLTIVEGNMAQVVSAANNTSNAIQRMRNTLSSMNFDNGSIDTVTKDLEEMGVAINNASVRMRGNNLDVTVKGVDRLGEAITVIRRFNSETGQISDVGRTISMSFGSSAGVIKDINKEMAEFVSLQTQITNIKVKIGILEDAGGNKNQIAELNSQLKTLEDTYASLMHTFMGKLTVNADIIPMDDITRFDDEIYKAESKLREFKAKLADKADANVFKELNADIDKFAKLYGKITSMQSEIGKLEAVGGKTSQIAELKRQLEELESTYTRLMGTFMKKLNVNADIISLDDMSRLDEEIAAATQRAENELREFDAKLADTRRKAAQGIKTRLNDGDFDNALNKINTEASKLSATYPKLTAGIKEVKDAIHAMETAAGTGDEVADVEKLRAAYERYEHALKNVKNQLDINKRAEEENRRAAEEAAKAQKLEDDRNIFMSNIDAWLTKNSAAAKQFGAQMIDLKAQAQSCDRQTLTHLQSEFKKLDKDAEAAGLKMRSLTDRIKDQFAKYGNYFSVASVMMYAFQGLRDMFEQVKLIDSAMTELKKVTNETDASYNQFLSNAALRARELGTTINGLVESTADFARLGYGFEDSQKLAEVANIYAVVGDEIEGVEDATQSLVSTMAAFKGEMNGMSDGDFAMGIVDKMNEVSNNFAISSGGIGQALQRSASSMAAANNSLDETIAMITAANEVAQNPEKVGNALKTISMRIRAAKSELEEAGESTDGMAESTASLRQEMLALSGVDIMLDKNTFKSTYQIMDELSRKWKDLTDIQRATITELLAGKHQGNIMSSLMSNFDTARAALETSLNSSGSAMREHEKWSESLEARLNKLKAAWQSLSQAFMSSNFLKVALNAVTGLVDGLTKLIDTLGALPTIFGSIGLIKGIVAIAKTKDTLQLVGGVRRLADVINILSHAFPNAAKGIEIFTSALKSGAGIVGILKGALKGLWTVIAAHPILATIAAVGILITAFSNLKKKEEELAEKVEEVTSKFKERSEELKKLKGNYDTSSESSMISKYEKLSKGVDNLGRNVSLTSEEYSEYQSIVNQIANQIPSLVSGYDAQGNALLSCKGNVEELTAAYEKLIHVQNNKILTKAGDIEKNFENAKEDAESSGFWETMLWGGKTGKEMNDETVEFLEKVYGKNYSEEEISKIVNSSAMIKTKLVEALKNAGVDLSWTAGGAASNEVSKKLAEIMETDPSKLKGIIDDYYAQFDEVVEQQKTIAQAKLSEAFDVSSAISGLHYENIDEDLQAVARKVVSSLDKDFFDKLQEDGKTVEQWTTEMLNQLNSINKRDNAKIEAAFDLQTRFNGGEISYGEYVNGLEDTGRLIERLNLKPELESQLKISLGLDEKGLVDGYKKLKNRLADSTEFNMMPSEYEQFLKGLSAEEVSVLWQVIPELEATDYKEKIEDIKSALEKEMMLQGLTFDLNLEVEAAGIEALNTALAESVSATGLSSESITALKGRYADLEMQGYDLSSMFEETSTGIRLNRQEFNKLENAYATKKLEEVDGELAEMKSAYDDLGEAIKNCDDPIKKSELFNDRQTLAKRISEAATLASQYEGLTSAYNDWLSAEEAGQERDMYENIIKGLETVDDEISRGWIDDGAIEFLELLTGRTDLAGKSGKQLKEIYDGLDNTIKNTTYSIRDFFTVDEDGNSTNAGVYNFLDAIGQLEEEKFEGKDIVKRDDDDNIIGFDFELAGGDEVIAEALGVSEELVQIMVRAADDAGFVVSMDGTYRQLADLQNEAKTAADYLHEIGKTDFEFDFNTSSVESLTTQLKEAHKILDDKAFWNKDGTFNFDADGATEAMQIVSTLQAKLDSLTAEQYGIGLTVEDEKFEEPLEHLQDYGRKVATLNQLKLNPKTNVEEIEKLNGELDDIAKYFANLDGDLKVDLGFEADDNWEEVKKKIESGEVEIPTVLDIQANMDKNIETLADLALLNSGLLSDGEEETIRKKYKVEVEADEVDTSNIHDKINNAVEGTINAAEDAISVVKDTIDVVSRKVNIQIIAQTTGVEDVDNLTQKLNGLDDKTVQAIAEVLGQIDVDKLKQTMATLEPTRVEAIAQAIGKGDVDGLKAAISQLEPKQVQAIAEAFGYNDVKDLYTAIENLDPKTVEAVANALGIADVDSLKIAIDNLQPKTVQVTAETSGESKLSGLKGLIDGIKSKTVTITSWFKKITSGGSTRNDSNGFNEVDGTANVDGTTGMAFKRGSWGTKNSGAALVGELGAETLVRNGRYYTIGDAGAEFITYKKGDIIFNHKQTEELFKNGKVTSGGGRGKAFVEGTAFSGGTGGIGKVVGEAVKKVIESVSEIVKNNSAKNVDATTSNSKSTSNNTSGSKGTEGGAGKVDESSVNNESSSSISSSGKDDFEETIDWIEIAISRIEREIDNLDNKANNVYETWSSRNNALTSQISKVGDEIALQQKAYDEYMAAAKGVGLSSSYAEKVRNGTIDISTIKDEVLKEKISDYQEWYEKALNCKDAILELKEVESSLYAQRFENIQTQYDGILQGYEHTEAMLNEYISQAEERGYIVSKKYYQALINNEKSNIAELKREQDDLIAARDEAVASGKIAKNSEEWVNMCGEIDSVTQAIEESTTALLEFDNAMRDIDWQVFDLIQERISDITAESEFLIELMSNKDLFDDNGKFTEQGVATVGLHALNYNTSMYQADDYGKEVAKLDKQIAKDPYDQELINRRRELLELQRESILAAESEKNAIKDLVEEGINLELDALQEKIDLHNEELDSMKDLYDYQKNVEEQTENIASLRKQLGAYEGFDDEETRAKVQELKVSLEEAEADLQETEYDKFISDQAALLDTLYTEYETVLNSRLDNIDFLLEQVIDGINAAAGSDGTITSALGADGAIAAALGSGTTVIGETLKTEVGNVGTKLSTAMSSIWLGDGSGKAVIDLYGKDFQNRSTTANDALNSIKANVNAMVDDVDKDAKKKVEAPKTKPSTKANPTKGSNNGNNGNNGNKQNNASSNQRTDKEHYGVALAVWNGGYGWGNGDARTKRLKEKGFDASKVQSVVNRMGKEGYVHTATWIKKYYGITDKDLKKYSFNSYATGKQNFLDDEYAWTQENGQEFIVRPSDGAILTPIAKRDSVLTSAASNNIWDMANSPAEFIKDNLGIGSANVPSSQNVNNNITQHFENITFSMPNVHGYNDLLTEMQRDPKFEKLVLSMTIDRIAGRSSLSKGKSIR